MAFSLLNWVTEDKSALRPQIISQPVTTDRPDLKLAADAVKPVKEPKKVSPTVANLVREHMAALDAPKNTMSPGAAEYLMPEVKTSPIEAVPEKLLPASNPGLPVEASQNVVMSQPETEVLVSTGLEIKEAYERAPKHLRRFLLGKLFEEIQSLMDAAVDLQKFVDKRVDLQSKLKGIDLSKNNVVEKNTELLKSVENLISLINQGEEYGDKVQGILDSVLNTYNDTFSDLQTRLAAIGKATGQTDNRLLLQINQKKSEVNKFLTAIGGQTIFETAKKGVKAMERMITMNDGRNPEVTIQSKDFVADLVTRQFEDNPRDGGVLVNMNATDLLILLVKNSMQAKQN